MMENKKFFLPEKVTHTFFALWKNKRIEAPGDLSDGDDLQLKEWFTVLFQARRALGPVPEHIYDVKAAWHKVDRKTKGHCKLRHLPPVVFKYAASCVLIAGLSLYLYFTYEDKSQIFSQTESISPGSRKAELVLANGERILLDSFAVVKTVDALGVKLVNQCADSKLQYQVIRSKDCYASAYNTLNIPKGGEYSMFLADGTEIWMNSESSLRFPVEFSVDKREVWLEGEACFKVTENPEVPFLVHVNGFDIKVLGTSFNVCAYQQDTVWQTTLVEGKVEISGQKKKVVLHPSDQYILNTLTGNTRIEQVDTEFYTSWIDGKFYFEAYTFEEVVRKLERWYNFEIVYQNESIRHRRFSGTIHKDRSLEEILHHLEEISNVRFRITGKNIIAFEI